MKSVFIAVVAAASLLVTGAASAASGADLAKDRNCAKCHDQETKKKGPSWKDVSAKYKGDAAAEERVIDRLKEGKRHPKIAGSDEEIAALVKWAFDGGK
jgi:cytochrome c